MLRLIAVTVAGFALVSSAQALTPAPLQQPDGMITQVRLGCGRGRIRVSLVRSKFARPTVGILRNEVCTLRGVSTDLISSSAARTSTLSHNSALAPVGYQTVQEHFAARR